MAPRHPLYRSRNGDLLYKELPPVYRLYDNRDPATGERGDLEKFLHGIGHLFDRFDATLAQFLVDNTLTERDIAGDKTAIQGWLLAYAAKLFGVDLIAPDAGARRRELKTSIWISRRRGTRVAIDRAAEAMVGTPVVIVEGLRRILRAPHTADRPLTQGELIGKWHPSDALILHEPLPPSPPAVHATGFLARRPDTHAGLPVGTPHGGLRMRARQAALGRSDVDTRPASGSGAASAIVPFVVEHRRGVPCFPKSYEDRSLRTPDMRFPRMGRERAPFLPNPDAVTLFVRPPEGFFTPGMPVIAAVPAFANGAIAVPAPHQDKQPSQVIFRPPGNTALVLDPIDDEDDKHIVEGLRLDGRLRVTGDAKVELENCAVKELLFAPGFNGTFTARNCIFDTVSFTPNAQGSGRSISLIYVTVMGAARLPTVNASDSLFTDLVIAGTGTPGKTGCIRYSRAQSGFVRTHIHVYNSSFGPAVFLKWPCLPIVPPPPAGQPQKAARLPLFGEPGYGVLSDINPPAVANSAEDGGEVGAYHDQYHLARLAAASAKAGQFGPAGRRFFALYDTRLLADLPV